MSTEDALARLEHSAKALRELQGAHPNPTLSAVANGALTAGEAIVRVIPCDVSRRLCITLGAPQRNSLIALPRRKRRSKYGPCLSRM
jgi:hypothetical protein